ncbi:unnamed protein product [Cylicostephanus goldi]|uniref:Uncharacterized protein n=1 Tax=Cylicostephanus goldi TaxID=71465 RepID=A0A3P6QLJ0_CYLGO|nr:unnamed protein product [Cylicostephanus goldi]
MQALPLVVLLSLYGTARAQVRVRIWQPNIDSSKIKEPIRFWELVEMRPTSSTLPTPPSPPSLPPPPPTSPSSANITTRTGNHETAITTSITSTTSTTSKTSTTPTTPSKYILGVVMAKVLLEK